MKRANCKTEKLMFARQISVLIGVLFVMFSFTACATGVDHVKLYDPMEYKPAKKEEAKEAPAEKAEEKKEEKKTEEKPKEKKPEEKSKEKEEAK